MLEIVPQMLLCGVAILGLCVGLSRYGLVNASWPEVIGAIIGAVSLAAPLGLWSNLLGGTLLVAVLVAQIVKWLIGKREVKILQTKMGEL